MNTLMTLDIVTFDPGEACADASEFAEKILNIVESAWTGGAELVLLPEFTWLGLSPHLVQYSGEQLPGVAEHFRKEVLPLLEKKLHQPGKAAVIGTVPFALPDGQIRNRALIFADGRMLYQDKLHLTPWEHAFSPGERLLLWDFGGFRIAVIICLDIEIPELSTRLRDSGVELILCPSATETILGVERVNRCASARSVELGCYVGVSHLTGRTPCDLIDESVGMAALYRPSQAVFRHELRHQETAVHAEGSQTLRVVLDRRSLAVMRRMKEETNPSHLGKKMAGMERAIHIECPPYL